VETIEISLGLLKVNMLLDENTIKRKVRTIDEEINFRLSREKYRYYEPNGKCEEFINAVGSGNYFVSMFSAANGVGKTAVSSNIVAHICWKSDNVWFKDLPLFKDWPFPKSGRIVTNHKNIENLVRVMKEWFPAGRYKTMKKSKPFEAYWTTDTGHDFDIMTYDQDSMEFEGPTLGWIWFDEPPTEAIFKACVARLRMGGIIFISATPLDGSAWLYDHIIAGETEDPEMKIVKDSQRINITADVEDACIEHGVRGHLRHDDIQRMINEYSEDEKQARVHGLFQHLIGLVFKKWDRKIHVIKPFNINFRDYTVYHALDTHPRTPDMGIWIAVDRQGRKYVVDELQCQEGSEQLAQRVKTINSNYRIERKIIEPAAFIKDQHTGIALTDRLEGYGLTYIEATKNRTASDRRIQDALFYQKVGDSNEFLKAPELYFFETCPRAIWEMEHYRWDEWSGKSADNKNPKEKPVDKDDHIIEDIGRILIQEPKFVEPPVEREEDTVEVNPDPYD
jgi:phage terminase large subunit-like protein